MHELSPKDNLIKMIGAAGKLEEFLTVYHLRGLRDATTEQLLEYVTTRQI